MELALLAPDLLPPPLLLLPDLVGGELSGKAIGAAGGDLSLWAAGFDGKTGGWAIGAESIIRVSPERFPRVKFISMFIVGQSESKVVR